MVSNAVRKGYLQLGFEEHGCSKPGVCLWNFVSQTWCFQNIKMDPKFQSEYTKLTNSQVWIQIFGLSLEYWRPSLLFDVVKGVGKPLRIDEKKLNKEMGLYA